MTPNTPSVPAAPTTGAEEHHLSPDCEVRSHHACSGDAWDHAADAPTRCECACHHVTLSTPRTWPLVLALAAVQTAALTALLLPALTTL